MRSSDSFKAPPPGPGRGGGAFFLLDVVVAEDLVGTVEAVLLGEEPADLGGVRCVGADQPGQRGVAVRDVEAGRLVVPRILIAGGGGVQEGRRLRGGGWMHEGNKT